MSEGGFISKGSLQGSRKVWGESCAGSDSFKLKDGLRLQGLYRVMENKMESTMSF